MKAKERRTETLAMRIAPDEHKRLRNLAVVVGTGEADLVRRAVNEWCARENYHPVFRAKGATS